MEVSIIIVTYNSLRLTEDCIESVFSNTVGLDFELILVDNASKDGSKEHFEADCRVKYIYNDENLGFGRANNLGIEFAHGRNILFLNSDTILKGNPVKILSEYLDSHPDVGACGANLFKPDGAEGYSFSRHLPSVATELNTLLHNVPFRLIYGSNTFFNHKTSPISVGYITGADLMVKKSVLDEVGVFDPSFFLYYEETELCHRIRQYGYKLMSVPSASIIHLEGASFDTPEKRCRRQATIKESRDNYFRLVGKGRFYSGMVRFLASHTMRKLFLVEK